MSDLDQEQEKKARAEYEALCERNAASERADRLALRKQAAKAAPKDKARDAYVKTCTVMSEEVQYGPDHLPAHQSEHARMIARTAYRRGVIDDKTLALLVPPIDGEG